MQDSVEKLWERYRSIDPSAPIAVPVSFYFCDNKHDADICAELVLAGRKQATATSLAELTIAGDPLPQVGDFAIVTDWAGRARAIIQTTSVNVRKFGDVNEDFAVKEGEGDLTLEWWKAAHESYYSRVLKNSDYVVDEKLEIACEEFKLLLTV